MNPKARRDGVGMPLGGRRRRGHVSCYSLAASMAQVQ